MEVRLLELKRSLAYRKFKDEIGQANHFLITILVGLDAVQDKIAIKKPGFDVTWEPRDVVASAKRSRFFAIKSSLGWIVDNLDMYLRLCNQEPKLLSDTLSHKFDGTENSVYRKYKVIIENYTSIDPLKKAYVDLLICWRNRMIHYDVSNPLLQNSIDIFMGIAKTDIRITKYKLDIDRMLKEFDDKDCPTFKELAFMIKMTIDFIEEVDNLLLSSLDTVKYMDRVFYDFLNKDESNILKYWCNDVAKQKKWLTQFFVTNGFIITEKTTSCDEYIDNVSTLSFDKIKECLKNRTFLCEHKKEAENEEVNKTLK
jgi:hypothetical protein